jgi:hypothetical protein
VADWRERAACVAEVAKAKTPDEAGRLADQWYPETLPRNDKAAAEERAIAICESCPVAQACQADRGHTLSIRIDNDDPDTLKMMLRKDVHGIRAGRQKGRRDQAKCGTPGGYYRHRRTLKEEPCQPCKDAHTADQREREQRRQAA